MFNIQIRLSITGLILTLTIPAVSSGFINGVEVTPGEFPHQAAVMTNATYICSGSVIALDWVLTAAHCVQYSTDLKLDVALNSYDLANPENKNLFKIEQKIIHENYISGPVGFQNDVALLKLRPNGIDTSKNIIKIARHTQCNNKTYAGQNCTTSGWGRNADGHFEMKLQMAYISVLSNEECIQHWNKGHIFDENVCIQGYSTTEGSIPCNGDGGAPLVCGDTLVGVNSWGFGNCYDTSHAIYARVHTRVTSFYDWINSNCDDCIV